MAKRKVKPNKKFYALIAGLVALVAIVAVLLLRTTGGRVAVDSVSMEASISAVVIRDENVTTAETYGKISYFVTEGERITSGTKIAEVYRWGTYDSVQQDLLTIQQEIRNYQVGTVLADIVNSELASMDDAIDKKLDEIAAVVSGDSTLDVLALERELKTLMESRREYLKNTLQPDDTLMTLYSREQTLLDRLASWKQDVYSQSAGMVSFFFDGYEAVLNRTTMAQVLPSDIRSVLNGKAAAVSTTSDKPLYRVVNTQRWYLAVLTNQQSDAKFVVGETYSIVLDGNYDKPYTAVCESQSTDDGTTLNFLRIDDDVAPVMGTRTVEATAQATFTGLTVASRAIVTRDGVTGINVINGSEKTFVPVTVMYTQDGNTAIRANDGYTLTEGTEYSAG